MKTFSAYIISAFLLATCLSCKPKISDEAVTAPEPVAEKGESAIKDTVSEKNILKTIMTSADHKTLANALKAADYEDAICNCGPFTFFAPTDDAFARLPAGTLENLLKPENKGDLQDFLQYHVYIGVIHESMVEHGMKLDQLNSKKVTLTKEGQNIQVNGGNIISTIPVSNGIIYVVDKVLLTENI